MRVQNLEGKGSMCSEIVLMSFLFETRESKKKYQGKKNIYSNGDMKALIQCVKKKNGKGKHVQHFLFNPSGYTDKDWGGNT